MLATVYHRSESRELKSMLAISKISQLTVKNINREGKGNSLPHARASGLERLVGDFFDERSTSVCSRSTPPSFMVLTLSFHQRRQ